MSSMRSAIEFSKIISCETDSFTTFRYQREESEPFVMSDTFYGQTFEDAVDTLDSICGDTISSPAVSPSI